MNPWHIVALLLISLFNFWAGRQLRCICPQELWAGYDAKPCPQHGAP